MIESQGKVEENKKERNQKKRKKEKYRLSLILIKLDCEDAENHGNIRYSFA